MKRARAPIAVPAADMEAAVVTAAAAVVVMAVEAAEAAIATAIVAPAATTANQGGRVRTACVSGRLISEVINKARVSMAQVRPFQLLPFYVECGGRAKRRRRFGSCPTNFSLSLTMGLECN